MRRSFIGSGAALACISLVLSACGGSDGSAKSSKSPLVWVSYGGIYQDGETAAYLKPFKKDTGVNYVTEDDPSIAKLKAMVKAKNVSWDVVAASAQDAIIGCREGWLEKIPADLVPAKQLNVPRYECGIPVDQNNFVQAYNTDKFKTPPSSWADFFDVKKFPGKRAIWNFAGGGALEAALLADGVAPDDLYPLDYKRALKKLSTIRDSLVFYDSGSEMEELMSSGEAVMGITWPGRMKDLAAQGKPIALAWKDYIVAADVKIVPAGAPHKAAAFNLLKHAVSKDAQKRLVKETPYAAVIDSANSSIPEKSKPWFGPASGEKPVLFDGQFYADNLNKVYKAWDDWSVS